MGFNIRNDIYLDKSSFTQLGFRIKNADGIHIIPKQFHPVGLFIPERINIQDATPQGKLAGFIYKISSFKSITHQGFHHLFQLDVSPDFIRIIFPIRVSGSTTFSKMASG